MSAASGTSEGKGPGAGANSLDPHAGAGGLVAGVPLDQLATDSGAVVILVHGRGGDARGMLPLGSQLGAAVSLAPQALGNSWYPNRFLSAREANEPFLSSALGRLDGLVAGAERAGIGRERIVLVGFSQGACLALEFAASRAVPRVGSVPAWGGVVAWSGALIGAETRAPAGRLDGVPVFLGCSERDPHIPLDRVHASAAAFEAAGARVDTRVYPGMAHTVNADEVAAAAAIVDGVARRSQR